MLSLVKYELKKIFQNKWLLFYLLFVVLILPIVLPYFSNYGVSHICSVDDDGRKLSKEQYRKEYARILDIYYGDMMDPYYQKKITDKKTELLSFFEEYGQNGMISSSCEERKYQITNSVVMNLDSQIENYAKESIHYTGSTNADSHIEEKIEYLNTKLKESGMIVGDDTAYRLFFYTISITFVLLIAFFLFISPSIFNKEDKDQTISLLKTTKEGKRKIAGAKIFTLLLLALIIPIIHYLWTTLLISFRFPFHPELMNLNSLTTNAYTYGEEYLWGFISFPIATLAIVGIGAFLSSFLRSPYLSLGILILFIAGPMFMPSFGNFNYKMFFPIQFMNIYNIGYFDLFYIENQVIEAIPIICLFWLFCSSILLVLSYYGYYYHQVSND